VSIPSKHRHRWEIKHWLLCDSVKHFPLTLFILYRRAKRDADKTCEKYGLAHTVVMKLMKKAIICTRDTSVFTDNLFRSVSLAIELYRTCTYVTATTGRNRKFLLWSLRDKFVAGEKYYFCEGPIPAAGCHEKTQRFSVLVLSTHTKAGDFERVICGQERNIAKPAVSHSCSRYMGRIDMSDIMVMACPYVEEKRTVNNGKRISPPVFFTYSSERLLMYE